LLVIRREAEVAVLGRQGLIFPVGEWVGSRRHDSALVLVRGGDETGPKALELGAHFGERPTNGSPDLDLRKIEFIRDIRTNRFFGLRQDSLRPLAERTSFGIDNLVFFLDADREVFAGDRHAESLPSPSVGVGC